MPDVRVCSEGEIVEGGVRMVTAGELVIGVIRHSGEYFAYRNICPHQGGPVCEGVRMPGVRDVIGEGGLYLGQKFDEEDIHLVCPWHGYEFHLSDGSNVCDARLRLQKFEVVRREGEIFVTV